MLVVPGVEAIVEIGEGTGRETRFGEMSEDVMEVGKGGRDAEEDGSGGSEIGGRLDVAFPG